MIENDLDKVLNYMKRYVENVYEHDSEIMLNWKDIQLVLEEIERLAKEVEKLEKVNQMLLNSMVTEAHTKETKEIERLNNIINELEKWLEVNLTNLEKEKANNTYDKGLKQGMLSNGRLIKNKLQELKGSDKE